MISHPSLWHNRRFFICAWVVSVSGTHDVTESAKIGWQANQSRLPEEDYQGSGVPIGRECTAMTQ
jgi:hypothetical protein